MDKNKKSITWRVPGSDAEHFIPEGARVFFCGERWGGGVFGRGMI